ncbi:MAG: diacylglycerol kinase [Candidatus Magasanikbacteria bacterium]|nr:diacylglycerol kinase [Candidatus Magasanikbacteria bacterium]
MIIKNFFNSLRYAARGLQYVFKHEQNFRLQVLASCFVIGGMALFPLNNREIILLIILITMVLTMEILNTAFERFADLLKPRLHEYVSVIKDIMAAAVFLTSLAASIIGAIIFIPHFLNWFK